MKRTADFLGIIIRVLVIIGFIAIGIVVYQSCAGSPLVQRIDEMPPDIDKAKYQILTMTKHDYYADEAWYNGDGSATIRDYFKLVGKKWRYVEGERIIPKVLKPEIKRR